MKKISLILTLKILYCGLIPVLIVLASVNFTLAQNTTQKEEKVEWEKITPLITKKVEVEEIFGKPSLENEYLSVYRSEFGNVTVSYHNNSNVEKMRYKCNVSPDTVVSYRVSLEIRRLVSDLGWNLNKFEKLPGDDGRYIYTNIKKGISFSVDVLENGDEEVRVIWYEPSIDNKNNNNCVEK